MDEKPNKVQDSLPGTAEKSKLEAAQMRRSMKWVVPLIVIFLGLAVAHEFFDVVFPWEKAGVELPE